METKQGIRKLNSHKQTTNERHNLNDKPIWIKPIHVLQRVT